VHNWLVDAGSTVSPTLALTFDACGGPGGSGVDRALLDLLEGEGIAATLFLNQRWIEANRTLADRLVASSLFEIGNHGSRHLPLSVSGRSAYGIDGTVDAPDAVEEVWANHQLLTSMVGKPPRWFRSGTAHYDEVATSIAVELGEQPVGFTTNGDLGATASAAQVATELRSAPPGGIVLAHMNQPAGGTAAGLAAALPDLRAAGVRLVTLSDGGGTRA
jgi:peptidoglycan/xylan/chitin deacetylase (PgdA/CDA1 family)